MQGARVPSLVGELRLHILPGAAPSKKKKWKKKKWTSMRYSWSLLPRIVVIRNMRCDILLFNNDSFLAPLGMGEFKVHRVRFFNYVPSGIRCVAYNNQSNRLAVSRTDGTVEIYNLSANYFQEKVSHLGAWFGVFDVNFFLKFNSAKSMFFVFKEIKRIVTLPHSLRSCLEPHNRYAISCLNDALRVLICVMLVRKIRPRNCGAPCHLETEVC